MYGSEELLGGKLIGNTTGSSNAGFALLGYSGCGKSSALQIAMAHYPQVIMHYTPTGKIPQVTYLAVNCISNSNFSALYVSIGDALDRALGLTNGTYANMIGSKRTLGEKAEKVRELIEIFAVGLIIFDEIQLIDFSSTRENTFNSLMTLTNRTKVAIAVVGTEDAYNKMFSSLQTAQRIGTIISGHAYCENRTYFELLVCNMMAYQWFDTLISPIPELFAALYENTHGIIDQLISLYMYMNIDYLSSKTRPQITPEYVYKVSDKYYKGIRSLLDVCDNPLNDSERQKLTRKANESLKKIMDNAEQESFCRAIEKEAAANPSLRILKSNIVRNIQQKTNQYTVAQISASIDKVFALKKNQGLDEQQLTVKVFENLQKLAESSPAAKSPKKITPEEMIKYVFD